MKQSHKTIIYSALSGALFSLGLVVSGMTNPAKVLAFLNLAGLKQGISWNAQLDFWDPSLALVMSGALLVSWIGVSHASVVGRRPWVVEQFKWPTQKHLDKSLISGAALFGIGWGLAGYCPGPVLASTLVGGLDMLIFLAAMLLGMFIAKLIIHLL
ncbi:MAG: hypothetical protein RI956_791 [Pseudomonadota bacterium]|jgi:uncharacterized membrane protein YedE/YeeE